MFEVARNGLDACRAEALAHFNEALSAAYGDRASQVVPKIRTSVYRPASLAFRVPNDGWWLRLGVQATTGGRPELLTDVVLNGVPARRRSAVIGALEACGFRHNGDLARRRQDARSLTADSTCATWLPVITQHIDDVMSCGGLDGLVRVHR
jgi:hypothetical protein